MCVGFLYTAVRRVLFSRVTKQSREDISPRTGGAVGCGSGCHAGGLKVLLL